MEIQLHAQLDCVVLLAAAWAPVEKSRPARVMATNQFLRAWPGYAVGGFNSPRPHLITYVLFPGGRALKFFARSLAALALFAGHNAILDRDVS